MAAKAFASLSPAASAGAADRSPLFQLCRENGGGRGAFTAAQYEELEQQAHIYKYLVAGVPVPPELLAPVRRGMDAMAAAARFYQHHHPNFGFGVYYGKKVDLEPGRCRRTDGKKWRCSKEAAPDSKYCERHMHRGRNRSRKPVEAPQPVSQTQQSPSASTVTSIVPAGGGSASSGGGSSFGSHLLYPNPDGNSGGGGAAGSFALASGASELNLDHSAAFGSMNKDMRYAAYNSFFSDVSGNPRSLAVMDAPTDISWRIYPSSTPSLPFMSYSHYGAPAGPDLGQAAMFGVPSRPDRQPLAFFGGGSEDYETVKQEGQLLRPFFDEWPKARDSWPDITGDNSGMGGLGPFPATQLSISMASSSDFSTTSSRSPKGD